jgi:hypothetical protein
MTGEDDEIEIAQSAEKRVNIIQGSVSGTVFQFGSVHGDIVLNARESPEND